MKLMRIQNLILSVTSILLLGHASQASALSPCTNSPTILTYLNRPSYADSACTVPVEDVLIEMGYAYADLVGGGQIQNYPQPSVRFGLPQDTELVVLPPNYYIQSIDPRSGLGSTSIGIKHQFINKENWVLSLEGYITPSSGSNAFGNDGMGGMLTGILLYEFNSAISITVMLDLSSQTASSDGGGQRFNYISPDLVLAWQVNERLQTYGELFAQTQVAPGEGAGLNFDMGALYLITKNIEIDAEVGRRIAGNLGGYNTYIGVGFAVLL